MCNTIKIAGMEWLILDKTDKGYFVITKDFVDYKDFSEINNDWRSSSLREYLHSDILKKIVDDIGEDNIISFERDLLSLDGSTKYGTCEDKVSLLTVDEYRKYREHLPETGEWWWLITPWDTLFNNDVAMVSPQGSVSSYNYDCKEKIRPCCIFSFEALSDERITINRLKEMQDKYKFMIHTSIETKEDIHDFCVAIMKAYGLGLCLDDEDLKFVCVLSSK